MRGEELAATLAAVPPLPDLDPMRAAYASGAMGLPVSEKSAAARTVSVAGPRGNIDLRIIAPEVIRGVYLHSHGGGWMLGTNDMQDNLLEHVGQTAGRTCHPRS